jgi:hypothetical protein
MEKSIVEEREGYRIEKCTYAENEVCAGSPAMSLVAAVTPAGHYIGTPKDAEYLIVERGIKPELRTAASLTCSIGFCEREQKWYGWSHRALAGFGIGDRLFEADWPQAKEDTPYIAHGDVVIANLEQARQAACNFAESVS